MVNAQQARRFLDRVVGYQLSPLLWKKVGARNFSAGRVQSVAVRLIADREREIRSFVTEEYWKIAANLRPAGLDRRRTELQGRLDRIQRGQVRGEDRGRSPRRARCLAGRPFSSLEGRRDRKARQGRTLRSRPARSSSKARSGFGFPAKKTMRVAQELYEGIDVDGSGPVGLITYMRTDSLRVSDDAMSAVRDRIKNEFGERYLPAKPIRYAAGKLAQEAHEAIRPTDMSHTPDRVKSHLNHDQFRLYQLIYNRFLASQMAPAIYMVTDVSITAGSGLFKAQGKIKKFDGHRRVWPQHGKQDDQLLPPLSAAQALDLQSLDATQHFTQPPPRYSEATLIKALEKEAIGRPSTYAPIIQTIQDRGYVDQQERRFRATDLGMAVNDLLVDQFPKILDLKFTAHMEGKLDEIASAKADMVKVLDEFYYPFQEELRAAETHMERVQIPTSEICHLCSAPMVLKFGKTGQFLGCSKYPECKATRPIGGQPRAEAVASEHVCPKCSKPLLIRENKRGEKFYSCSGFPECKESFNIDPEGKPVRSTVETEHKCEKCGKPMVMRQGRRGAFIGCTGYPKCRNALPVDDQGRPVPPVKVEVACPKCGGVMAVRTGRRGPFLGCTKYPKCRGTAPVPDDLKDQIAAQPSPAKSSQADDLKAVPVEETCEDCGGPMLVRRSRRGFFLGCAKYPECKGTRQPGDATLAKINEVVKA